MIFEPQALPEVVLVRAQPSRDERGSFTRLFCAQEFAAQGLETGFVQDSLSLNHRAGTLRGLHFQLPPQVETKLVTCVNGRVFDVAVDLRRGSPTQGRWVGVELDAAAPAAVYVPAGFAHGFLTLEDDVAVLYKIMPAYVPGSSAGVIWNDPALAIAWPRSPNLVGQADQAHPSFAAMIARLGGGL
jgi:dTDP-4-dehydrorhamnose 3,5-epimerase